VGIGSVSFVPLNMLDVKGNAVIGNTYSGVNTAPANGLLVEGKVGIGNVSPTEQLHVTGNVRFSGALMPNNLPGSSGQLLTSQGAGLPPVWTNASSGSTQVYTVAQSSALAVSNTNSSFQLIPGLTYNLVLASAAKIMISTTGTIASSSYGSGVDVAILINGNAPTAGGLQRVCVTGYSPSLLTYVIGLDETWGLNVVESLAAGSYTITVQARSAWVNAYNYDATVGSTALAYDVSQTTTTESSTRKQGVMHIIVF
jgi:hypothetical protein